jgi:hypothetical protein
MGGDGPGYVHFPDPGGRDIRSPHPDDTPDPSDALPDPVLTEGPTRRSPEELPADVPTGVPGLPDRQTHVPEPDLPTEVPPYPDPENPEVTPDEAPPEIPEVPGMPDTEMPSELPTIPDLEKLGELPPS